jgi:hypothetical protein
MNANTNRMARFVAAVSWLIALHQAHAQTDYVKDNGVVYKRVQNADGGVTISVPEGTTSANPNTAQQGRLQQLQQAQGLATALGGLFESLARSREARKPSPDLNRFDTPVNSPQVAAPPVPDPRKVEEQKRLQEMKNLGLDKATWDNAVSSYRNKLTSEQKVTFDSNLKELVL